MTDRDTPDRLLLLVAMVLVAFNLRPAVSSVPPVLEAIRVDLALSYTAAGLLTTIPTLCMGGFALAAAPVARRFGRERGVLWAVVLIGVGTAARLWGMSAVVLFGSTLLLGVGIAICQTLLPSLVNAYFLDRAALVTGLYTTSLTIGAAVGAGFTVPLVAVVGGWPQALAAWAFVALLAFLVWLPVVRGRASAGGEPDAASTSEESHLRTRSSVPFRSPWAWAVALFFGAVSLLFYSGLTWLAPRYVELGWSAERAGLLLTFFVLAQLVGTLGLAGLADRWTDRRPFIALSLGPSFVGLAGMTVVPLSFPYLWAGLAGAGLGGVFALSLTLPVDYAPDADAADRLTALVLGVGYLIAAAGPFVVGAIRDTVGSYPPAFASMAALSVVALVGGMTFKPGRVIDTR